MSTPNDVIGASGHFVSAVLEASGEIALSNMLIGWAGFFTALGVLFFVFSAVLMLRNLIDGEPQRPLWLILGPLIALGMLKTTAPVGLQNDLTNGDSTLPELVRVMVGQYDTAGKYRIPLFISVFTRLVDSSIGALNDMLGNDDNQAAYIAAARDKVYVQLLFAKGQDRDFLTLLARSLSGDCAKLLVLARDLNEPRLRNAVPGSAAAVEAASKRASLEHYRDRRFSLSESVLSYLTAAGIQARPDPTCGEIWQYSADAAAKLVQKMLAIDGPLRQDYLMLTDEEWREIVDDIYDRLIIPTNDVMDRVHGLRMLAGIFLNNSMNSSTLSAFITQIEGHQDWMFPGQDEVKLDEGSLLQTLRVSSTRFAASVPYVQGMLLYLLLLGFPFFVIAGMIPRRAGTILLWCGLWLWVKSWSVGYAVIWVIRNILWETLPSAQLLYGAESYDQINWDDPASLLLWTTTSNTYLQLNSYQSAVAIMILAVPAITAYFFQGATQLLRIASSGFANDDGLERRRFRGREAQETTEAQA